MGSNQGTSIGLKYPLVLGPRGLCGGSNIYSLHCMEQYRLLGHILTSLCKYCCAEQREAKQRAATLKRPDEKAKAKTVKDTGTMTEAAPYAEEAEKLAVIKAEEARPKMEELKASAKAVKDAKEATEAAHKAKEEKAEESAVIRAEEDRLYELSGLMDFMYDEEIGYVDWDSLNFKTYGSDYYEEKFPGFDEYVYKILADSTKDES